MRSRSALPSLRRTTRSLSSPKGSVTSQVAPSRSTRWPSAAGAPDRLLDVARVVERGLVRPDVHRDAEPRERRADEREHRLRARAGELGSRRVRTEARLLGDRNQVLALVTLLVRLFAPRPGQQRPAEVVHLRARVVEVVLAHDVVPGEREQPGEAVAVRRVAAGRDRQRAGGVGGHELDVDLEPLRSGAASESGLERRLDRLRVPRRRRAQVEEARAGDLGAGHPRARRGGRAQGLRDLARGAAERPGEPQRERARVVAAGLVGGALERGVGIVSPEPQCLLGERRGKQGNGIRHRAGGYRSALARPLSDGRARRAGS